MKRKVLAFFCLSVALAATPARAGRITKGPYLQFLGTDAVTVAWETDEPTEAVVEYGGTPSLGRTAKPEGAGDLRKARLWGLVGATRYYYRVKDGDAASLTYTFETMPEKGPFTFAAYGDTRTNPKDHFVVTSLIAARRGAFVLHTGDLVANGSVFEQWEKQFFEPAGGLLARFSLFAVAGNHERESEHYYNYFGAPSGTPWYSFDCSNAHFVMLNTCLEIAPGSDQYRWLVEDLSSSDKLWRFAAFHHPPYSSASHRSSIGVRRILGPLFAKYGVDIVFNGHDHTYERTHPVVSALEKAHPVTYIVTGGGGAPRYDVAGDFFTAASRSDLHFCMVKIDGAVLEMAAIDGGGAKFDSLRIVKSEDGYANDYLARTVPMELAEAEALTETAMGRDPLEYPAADRTEEVAFEFSAPAWGEVELQLNWRSGEDGATVSPENLALTVPAGQTVKAVFELAVKAEKTERPTLSVRGTTSLGEFWFEDRPLRFRRKGDE